jgi:MerR family transcriptional regulator/heat shock protein HspR
MKEKNRMPLYMIGVAAQLAGVHPQTLRLYERLNLLTPARTVGKTRLYSEEDIRIVRRIQELTQGMGLNLAGVKLVMEMEREIEKMRKEVEEMKKELEKEKMRMRREIQEIRKRYKKEIVLFRGGDILIKED